MNSNKVIGCETLARLVKANGEIIPPGKFIPFIEESRDALVLDWYILDCACKFLVELRNAKIRLVPISINFSKMHALEPDFINKLLDTVDKYELDHELIKIEFTESDLEYYASDAKFIVNQLREHGFGLVVDNFGTGISSLNFLREFDFDVLKIDRSLISSRTISEKDKIIVKMMIELGGELGMQVVAEGVETKEQADILSAAGCKNAQGFYYSRPVSNKLLVKYLQ